MISRPYQYSSCVTTTEQSVSKVAFEIKPQLLAVNFWFYFLILLVVIWRVVVVIALGLNIITSTITNIITIIVIIFKKEEFKHVKDVGNSIL